MTCYKFGAIGPQFLERSLNLSGEKHSTRSYRWVRIWMAVGVLLALLLLGNSVRDYFFVARILSIQQVRRQVTQRIADFENELRESWTPGTSQLKLLVDDMAAASQQPDWIVLRSMDGQVLEQSGTPERQVFTHDDETNHFRNREPVVAVIPSNHGEVVVEAFPVHVGPPGPPIAARSEHHGPFITVEVAMPLGSSDAANLWPIRRNLLINVAAAFTLLLTVGLTAWGFRSYIRGRQLEQQVEIARQVQINLLPKSTQVAGSVPIAVAYQAVEEVAGDFYDTFQTERGLALVIGDVSGKGIPAALLMGVIHGAVRSSRWTDSPANHERETVELNRLLCERASTEQFASMFWSYCDRENNVVHYVNAGHCIPLLVGLHHGRAEIKRLDVGGPVLGLLPDAAYVQGRAKIQPGDVIVLYSDGLVEATNTSGEEFGESRLEKLLLQTVEENPLKIRDSILAGVRDFLHSATAHDDLTCLVAKFDSVRTPLEQPSPALRS
jgi:Stage II sporulation protein E (SpoIIE)